MVTLINQIKQAFDLTEINTVMEGSVNLLNDKQVDYTCVVIDPVEANVEGQFINYRFRVYVLDRMIAEGDENVSPIWDSTQSSLIHGLFRLSNALELPHFAYTIHYVRDDFHDLLAGVWTDVTLTQPIDINSCW